MKSLHHHVDIDAAHVALRQRHRRARIVRSPVILVLAGHAMSCTVVCDRFCLPACASSASVRRGSATHADRSRHAREADVPSRALSRRSMRDARVRLMPCIDDRLLMRFNPDPRSVHKDAPPSTWDGVRYACGLEVGGRIAAVAVVSASCRRVAKSRRSGRDRLHRTPRTARRSCQQGRSAPSGKRDRHVGRRHRACVVCPGRPAEGRGG